MDDKIKLFIEVEVKESGWYFDSHTVIEYLIQNHTTTYLQGVGANDTKATYHGRIAQIIDKLVDNNNNKIANKAGTAISKNITDNFSKCQLWRKN